MNSKMDYFNRYLEIQLFQVQNINNNNEQSSGSHHQAGLEISWYLVCIYMYKYIQYT